MRPGLDPDIDELLYENEMLKRQIEQLERHNHHLEQQLKPKSENSPRDNVNNREDL